MRPTTALIVAAAALAGGCAAPARTLILESGPRQMAALLAAHPPEAGRNITPVLLERSERSSVHLVWVSDREQPHLHAEHDLVVTMLAGRGTLWIRDRETPMHAGDVAFVPAGVPHWFVNLGDTPAAALSVFTPPSDGSDNVPVEP